MRWYFRGRQIGQAVKNVQRLQHIVAVFSRHGFEDILTRMGLEKFTPLRWRGPNKVVIEKNIAQRLRECFEELGPTFVKLGQLLSTRPDVIPDAFIEEFKKLQDNVQPIPYEKIKAVIESEFKKPAEQVFAYIDPSPLASASIAQVHEARLLSGEKVVVKVQRPGIDKIIKNDISLLAFFARLLERYVPETRLISPAIIVDEFFKTLSYELDFLIEANNMTKFAHNMSSIPEVVIPKFYKDYSSQRILTQEKLDGIRVHDIKALDEAGIDRSEVVKIGAKAFFKSIMIDGLFHGDLHAGNLFVMSGNKLGIIDFGIMGRLSEKARDRLASMLMALLQEDFENLCYQYAELGAVDPSIDFENFEREVRSAVAPYMGLNISEVNSGKVFIESTKIAAKYKIRVPGEWMIVFKAILTVEGMGRTLDPQFDLLSIGKDLVKDLVKNQYSVQRFKKEFLWIAKDVATLLQVLPRQIRWMFRKFNRDNFAFEIKIPELDRVRREMISSSRRLSSSIIAASLFIASSLSLTFQSQHKAGEYPAVSIVLFSFGILFLIRVIFR